MDRLHLDYNEITRQSTIVDSPSGEYVLYDDHIAELERIKVIAEKLIDFELMTEFEDQVNNPPNR